MTFAKFANKIAPLGYRPVAKKASASAPWGKPHRWIWRSGQDWTVYPEGFQDEEEDTYRGYMINNINGLRTNGHAWLISELELITEPELEIF
jgi:hypothetical protein